MLSTVPLTTTHTLPSPPLLQRRRRRATFDAAVAAVRRSKARRPVHRVGTSRYPVFLVAATTHEGPLTMTTVHRQDVVTEEEQVGLI